MLVRYTIVRFVLNLGSEYTQTPEAYSTRAVDCCSELVLWNLPFYPSYEPRGLPSTTRGAIVEIQEAAQTCAVFEVFKSNNIIHPGTLEILLEYCIAYRKRIFEDGNEVVSLAPSWEDNLHKTTLVAVVQPNPQCNMLHLRHDTQIVDPLDHAQAKFWPKGTKFIGMPL